MDTLYTGRKVYASIGHTIGAGVYHSLRRAIMDLTLKPGEALNVKAMAERLGVSRTPVRDAFIQLEQEGLVDVVPQVGTRVSRIDLIQIIPVERKLLEEYSDYFKVSSGADIHGGSNSFRRT